MAEIIYTGYGSSLERLCQGAGALQVAAEPHWAIANEARVGSSVYFAVERAAEELTGAAERFAGQAAAIPAETHSEVIAKAQLVVALSHSAEDEKGELATSLARDVLRLLAQ